MLRNAGSALLPALRSAAVHAAPSPDLPLSRTNIRSTDSVLSANPGTTGSDCCRKPFQSKGYVYVCLHTLPSSQSSSKRKLSVLLHGRVEPTDIPLSEYSSFPLQRVQLHSVWYKFQVLSRGISPLSQLFRSDLDRTLRPFPGYPTKYGDNKDKVPHQLR
ncbi:hypothetical protein D3C71_1444730 [compost metagenome]